jgi:hypothetical protein
LFVGSFPFGGDSGDFLFFFMEDDFSVDLVVQVLSAIVGELFLFFYPINPILHIPSSHCMSSLPCCKIYELL